MCVFFMSCQANDTHLARLLSPVPLMCLTDIDFCSNKETVVAVFTITITGAGLVNVVDGRQISFEPSQRQNSPIRCGPREVVVIIFWIYLWLCQVLYDIAVYFCKLIFVFSLAGSLRKYPYTYDSWSQFDLYF